jgi:putative aldouronate transport system substrate-binding protein
MKRLFGVCRNVCASGFLAAVLCISGCSKTGNTSSAAGKKYDTVVFALMSFNNIPGDVSRVEEAVNKLTEPEIGVNIKLKLYGPSNYAQQVSLAMTGGEQLDIFHSLGDFSQIVSKGQAYDITDIINACAPDAKSVLGEKFIKTGYKDGKLYGLPAYKSYVLQPQFIYRKDIAEKLGLDLTGIKNMYDLTSVLEKVKAYYPQMNPFAPIEQGNTGIPYSDVDYLTDDMRSPKGVLVGDSTNVENFYTTEEFKKACALMHKWNQNGLISRDAASSTSIAVELISGGKAFGFIGSYGYPPEDTAVEISHQTGIEMKSILIGDAPVMATDTVSAITWVISSGSKHPESALKLLNLMYSDPNVLNTILYGIEGEDYVKNADGTVKYPAGQDASTVPYTAQLSCGILGNQFIQYTLTGTNPESLKIEKKWNEDAKISKAFGFMFDNSSVKTEYSSVNNVINQYLPGLRCGSIDPVKGIPEFNKKLEEAGLNKIISEKQKQLDTWLVMNK